MTKVLKPKPAATLIIAKNKTNGLFNSVDFC